MTVQRKGLFRDSKAGFLSVNTLAEEEMLPEELTVKEISELHPRGDDFAKVLIHYVVNDRLKATFDSQAMIGLFAEVGSEACIGPGGILEAYPRNGEWILVHKDDLRDLLEDVGEWPLHPDITLSHWWPNSSCLEADAISWPHCLATLKENLGASAEEVSIWIGNNRIQTYSLRSRRGLHAAETVAFLEEPATPVSDLLDRFKYSRTQIEGFDPEQDPDPGPVGKLSVVWGKIGWSTVNHNPSGRYLSFERTVEFLCGLPDLAPMSEEEVASAIRREMNSREANEGRIKPILPFGIGMNDPDKTSEAWYPEGSILMLAREQWGTALDGWDAATRRRDAAVQEIVLLRSTTGGRNRREPAHIRRLPIFESELLSYAKETCSQQVKESWRIRPQTEWTLRSFGLPILLCDGSKAELGRRCHKRSPGLFTMGKDGKKPKNGTFHKFWKTDYRKGLCRLEDEQRFKS